MFQSFNRIKQKLLHVTGYRLHKTSFTLIEMLVVATIISLLAAGGLVSYSTITKNSLDARRKADIEQIRAAVEMYKSNNASYPVSLASPLQDGSGNTYLQQVPENPKGNDYDYIAIPADGVNCDGTSSDPCSSYILSVSLENGDTYTAGPYGTETTTPTPTP